MPLARPTGLARAGLQSLYLIPAQAKPEIMVGAEVRSRSVLFGYVDRARGMGRE
jgi:hypothetical protein